jgi:very-short-patch-repair endonuclease
MTASEGEPKPSPLAGEDGGRRAPGEGTRRSKTTASIGNARALRRVMTNAERKLWGALRSRQLNGAKFRRQVPVGPFVAGFLCYGTRAVIEVDGGQHADPAHNRARDRWFVANGFRVLRFWNNDVLRNLEGVLETIAPELHGASPHPAPAAPTSPARGEGRAASPPAQLGPRVPPSDAGGESKKARTP